MNNKTVYVCMAANQKFAFYATIAAFSIRKNLDNNKDLVLYLIDNGLYIETKSKMNLIFKDNKINCNWIYPDKEITNNIKLPENSWLDDTSLLRLLLPELLPSHIERFIYVDSDMLIIDDLSVLFEVDMEGKIIAACQDYQYTHIKYAKSKEVYLEYGLSEDLPYLNAGLYVADVKAWNENKMTEKTLNILLERSLELTHSDQDAINAALFGNWKLLDPKWNVVTNSYLEPIINQELIANPSLIHYTGPKPGQAGCKHPERKLYFDYVQLSGWFNPSDYVSWRINIFFTKAKVRSRIAVGSLLRNLGVK